MRLITLITASTLIAFGFSSGAATAQSDEAVLVVDVTVVNDDGGELDGSTVTFQHPASGGGTTSGSDSDPDNKCLTTDGGMCYINSIPTGEGEITVTPVDGYTVTIECMVEDIAVSSTEDPPPLDSIPAPTPEGVEAESALSTASGSTWNADPFAEIFCMITLDDGPAPTTTTTAPPTTPAPTDPPATMPPVTEAPTTPAPQPEPTDLLPATGPSDNATLALVALLLIVSGGAIITLARR